jgi:hypothetical protein
MRCWEVGDAEHPKVFADQEAAQAGGRALIRTATMQARSGTFLSTQ